MNVTKLRIIDIVNNRDLAYLYPGEGTWRDPFGGDFTPDEQNQLVAVAEDGFQTVTLHIGTKHERTVHVRFAATFG